MTGCFYLLLMMLSLMLGLVPLATTLASQPTGCLDRRQSADYLSISVRLLDNLATAGEIPRVKIGSKTLFRVQDNDRHHEWEPFNREHDGHYVIDRHLYKNLLGNMLCFEEI